MWNYHISHLRPVQAIQLQIDTETLLIVEIGPGQILPTAATVLDFDHLFIFKFVQLSLLKETSHKTHFQFMGIFSK